MTKTESGDASQYPPWWPAGATEESARVCGCDYCQKLLDKLEQHRSGVAVDDENRTLDSFPRASA